MKMRCFALAISALVAMPVIASAQGVVGGAQEKHGASNPWGVGLGREHLLVDLKVR